MVAACKTAVRGAPDVYILKPAGKEEEHAQQQPISSQAYKLFSDTRYTYRHIMDCNVWLTYYYNSIQKFTYTIILSFYLDLTNILYRPTYKTVLELKFL